MQVADSFVTTDSASAHPAAQQWGNWQQGEDHLRVAQTPQAPVTHWWPARQRHDSPPLEALAGAGNHATPGQQAGNQGPVNLPQRTTHGYPTVHGVTGVAPPLRAGPGVVHVAAPKLEPQPWARGFWGWMRVNSQGVARVDLRRPTPPPPDMYRPNNLFVAQRPPAAEGVQGKLTGARVKITRNFQFGKDKEGKQKPLIDLGLGAQVEMDSASVRPVARLKIKNIVSIKALPRGVIKLAGCLPLGPTGLSAKVVYELPFNHISSFWTPPARLMVRLDNISGSGLHLSPTGIEFDERFVELGSRLSVRAALGLQFPRSLPIDPDNDAIGFKVHRLSLKSIW